MIKEKEYQVTIEIYYDESDRKKVQKHIRAFTKETAIAILGLRLGRTIALRGARISDATAICLTGTKPRIINEVTA